MEYKLALLNLSNQTVHLRRLLFFTIFFSHLSYLAAQHDQNYIFSHMGSQDGLLSDDIRSVTQDKKGYIWIATMNGLQRHDGQRFLSIRQKANDPFSLPNNRIFNLFSDGMDKLWLHCGENHLGYMNISDHKFHEVPVRYAENKIKTAESIFCADTSGSIMLLLFRKVILTYNKDANEFAEKYTPFTLPDGWLPRKLFHDQKLNNYWIGTDSGLVKYNCSTKKISYRGHNEENDEIIKAYSDITFISHPFIDHQGRFWLERWIPEGAGPFVLCYDPHSKIRTEWFVRKEITAAVYTEVHNIQESEDGSIWIVGLNLMACLSPSAKDFENIPSNLPGEFSIRYDIVKNLFQDREKNIWACTDKGLFRFNPTAQLFKIIPNRRIGDDHIYTQDVTDILQTTDGNILVSTWGSGTFSYDNNFKPTNLAYAKPMHQPGEDMTWAFLQRRNGDIWRVCQDGYIVITSASSKKTIRIHPSVFRSTIRQVIEDNNGDLWFGTHGGDLIKWHEVNNSFQFINRSSTVNRLYKDKTGTIWVCTGGNGVYSIDPGTNAIITHYTSTGPEGKKLMGVGVTDIIQYSDSIYIIASENLNLLNIRTGEINFLTEDNGLPTSSAENLIKDNKGYIWFTTEGHLCRLYLERSVTSTFSENDGLVPGSFNIASANMLNDGRIAIGRAHDFIVFDPDAIATMAISIPQPEITAFLLMNQWLPVDSLQKSGEVELRYNQNSVTLKLSALTYLNHFPIMYMMNGLDKNWIVAGDAEEAIYNYLPPGDYIFMAKCANGEGGFSDTTLLKITIRAPFWQTWWFYCVLALLAAGIFYWIDRERIRRKEVIQKMRGDIAGNLHEEINTALNNINVLSEIARIKADKEPEQSKNYINEIHQ